MLRARADHRGPGADEPAQALQCLRRHVHIVRRQNQHGVAGAAGENDAAIFYGRVTQYVGVHGVVVVAKRQRGIAGAHFHRRAFAREIRGVRDGAALLQEKLAVRDVINPRLALLPPRLRALEMKTPLAHRHARPAVRPRLHRVTMKNVAVQALAINQVAEGLERIRIVLPAAGLGSCGERFRADNGFAVNVRDGRREFDGRMAGTAAPKFAHHDIGGRAALQRFIRASVRLDRVHQSVLVAEFGKMAIVIFRKQIGDRAAHVPQKTLRYRRIVHHATGERGQIFQEVVAASLVKFFAEILRPVLAADFVAVNQRTVERLAGERAEIIENFLHEAVPMRVERGLAELVAFQAFAFRRRGMIFHAGRRVADAQNQPVAGRRVPVQPSIRREF